ncbi:hypothetical protein ALC57_05848 [Trachymyrmex cornetzi]|uniref:DUF4817 domain-containing protein n=1 Tax=Trachymyrmex cornetzi TaxID=471704 RepID=A0A151J9R2_9HYME|nr:hypothetical protein ALC57_05848 [Trachymyrmex cornetzi]
MSDYTPSEIVDMIMVLGETQNNFAAAARLYAQRFSNRRHSNIVTIRDLAARARDMQ